MSCLGITGELSRFEWEIANFFSLSAEKDSYYISPSFVFGNTSFHLRIYPAGDAEADSGFISVFLKIESKDPLHMNITLRIKKADGTLIGGATGDGYIETQNVYLGWNDFYVKSHLQQNKSELVPSNILTIVCILKPKQGGKEDLKKTETVESLHEKKTHKTLDDKRLAELGVLSENLKTFSSNKESCDTVLQVKDREFKAHKFILMARSSIFAGMFQHDTMEKQTGVVKIPDCDTESFQEFLDYIYCGKLEDISYNSAFQLYITSNKYNVQELTKYCVQYLIESLTADNVCEIVKLADKYDEVKLLSAAQSFFNENKYKIFVTSEWDNFMKTDYRLARKLLIELSKIKESQ